MKAADATTGLFGEVDLRDACVDGIEKVELPADVTIGMSAYGNYQTTLIALRSLFLSATGEFELILVDDCSPEADVRALFQQVGAEHAPTRVFFFKENREYSGSLNAILSHARGSRVIFLSNDIFVTPAYLRELLAVAEANPRHGIVRGCSNYVDNGKATHNVALDHAPRDYLDLFGFAHDLQGRHSAQVLEDDFLTGDAFLVTRAVLDRIGALDPLFYGYFADHDFGVRAQIAGFSMVLARGAFAYHQRAANFDYLPEAERTRKMDQRWMRVIENWARFKLKYGLPVELPYRSMLEVPWERLSTQAFDPARHYTAPGDYAGDLVSDNSTCRKGAKDVKKGK